MPIPGLKTRKPTGAVPYPCILLEGEEKAGKTWAAAQLSASDKVGETYWIDVAEGAADEYGVIPGVRYQIVEHDGSYQQILAAVTAVKTEAKRAQAAGEKPVVLVIDTGSALWGALKDWVDTRSRKTTANRKKLAEDPDAELKAPQNFWNDARARWYRVMNQLLTFPGIVIVTARGREVTKVVNGKPVEGEKIWKPETQDQFPYDVNVWLRMFRDDHPVVVGARSAHLGIVPGKDAERKVTASEAKGRLLEWLIFDALKCDPTAIVTRDLPTLSMGELSEEERADQEAEEAKANPAPSQVGQVVAAAQQTTQQSTQRPRRGTERAAQRPAGRPVEQWLADIAAATSRERLNELHAMASQAGQMTEGLLGKMQERAGQLAKATAPAVQLAAPAEQPAAAAEAVEEEGITEAERRGMLIEELAMIAELVGKSPDQLTARHLPNGPAGAPTEKLQEVVAGMRGLAIIKLKQAGRTAEAEAYIKVKPTECDTPANLLTDPEAPAATEADQAA